LLIFTGGRETDRHVFDFVLVDEEHSSELDRLEFEYRIGRAVGTDVGGGRGGGALFVPDSVQNPLGLDSSSISVLDRLRLDAIAAGSRMTVMGAVLDQFIGLQQNRQYDVTCQEAIGQNLSSADST